MTADASLPNAYFGASFRVEWAAVSKRILPVPGC